MRKFQREDTSYLLPETVEDVLQAIGIQEEDESVEIVFTHDLMADIATRLIRLEDNVQRGQRDE